MNVVAIVGLLVKLAEIAAELVPKLIEQGKRTGELSDSEVSAFRQRMEAAFAAPHWQPRPLAEGGEG